MTAKNDNTGNEIVHIPTEEYKDKWEKIFGDREENLKEKKFKTSKEVKEEEENQKNHEFPMLRFL